MDLQHAINLAIFERFAAEGIGFAYPTQTLYLSRSPKTARLEYTTIRLQGSRQFRVSRPAASASENRLSATQPLLQ
jgi:small-conductance mechanosensitive channel